MRAHIILHIDDLSHPHPSVDPNDQEPGEDTEVVIRVSETISMAGTITDVRRWSDELQARLALL